MDLKLETMSNKELGEKELELSDKIAEEHNAIYDGKPLTAEWCLEIASYHAQSMAILKEMARRISEYDTPLLADLHATKNAREKLANNVA